MLPNNLNCVYILYIRIEKNIVSKKKKNDVKNNFGESSEGFLSPLHVMFELKG